MITWFGNKTRRGDALFKTTGRENTQKKRNKSGCPRNYMKWARWNIRAQIC